VQTFKEKLFPDPSRGGLRILDKDDIRRDFYYAPLSDATSHHSKQISPHRRVRSSLVEINADFPEDVRTEYLAGGATLPQRLERRVREMAHDGAGEGEEEATQEELQREREGFVQARRARWQLFDWLVDTVSRYTT
jgi:hypothetical protein